MPAILEMIVREPNGEPRLLMILVLARLGEASRSTGSAFASELIPGGRAWQRIPALVESSRPGR
jgi:hypothetical protein